MLVEYNCVANRFYGNVFVGIMYAVKLLRIHFNGCKAKGAGTDFRKAPCIRACGEEINRICNMGENFADALVCVFKALAFHIRRNITLVYAAFGNFNAVFPGKLPDGFKVFFKVIGIDKAEIDVCGAGFFCR